MFDSVAIIGVGLIGGSIGLAVKKKKMARLVIGISRHKKTIDSALARKAIDRGFCDISAVREADLIILASPVSSIIQNGRRIAALIKPGALVTDTGSTKREIVWELEKVLPDFVGTHPLAGSEKQGVINSDENLFRDIWSILTPTRRTPRTALNKIKKFWMTLGAKVICISPLMHDRYISYVSHLPHVVAFSLIHSIPRNTFRLASGGLKDTTRIAASGDELWRDILATNADNVLAALECFDNSLSRIKSAIIRRDTKTLSRILRQARLKRMHLNGK